MNIYMDIDGVIIGVRSPRSDVVDLLRFIMEHYADSAYWLTTHCRGGENRCAQWLKRNGFPDALVAEMDAVFKPTDWDVLKTEAIDFSRPFVWLDDAPFQSEMAVLARHGAADSCIVMDKRDPQMARRALTRLTGLRDAEAAGR